MQETIFCEQLFKDFSHYFENYLNEAELAIGELQKPSYEMPEQLFVELLERSGNGRFPYVGIEIGSQLKPEHVGAIGHAVVNAPSVKTAIDIMVEYIVTYSHFAKINIESKADTIEIQYDISEHTILHKKQDAEFAISAIYRMLSLCAGKELKLAFVCFEHDKPQSLAQYKAIFNCPVSFNAKSSTLSIYSTELNLAADNRDSRLFDIIVKYLAEVKLLREKCDFKDKLSNLIVSQLSTGKVSVNYMSELLGMSVRTLQRKLDDNGLDFSQLLNNIRYQLALVYLRNMELSLSDISFKLGFQESSSFSRAFKRWASKTPKDYRDSIKNKA